MRLTSNRSGKAGTILKTCLDPDGYYNLSLFNTRRRTCYIHRLVARAFIGEKPRGYQVNHKNGKKTDCRAENLEYVTPKQNSVHASRTGLLPVGEASPRCTIPSRDVREMRRLHADGVRVTDIAKQFGRARAVVSGITSWKHRRYD